jgi:glycerol-3-phosphate cytidylyltransferase
MRRVISTAYVGGTFDLLHVGHIRLFKAVRALGHRVHVSLNTDEFAASYKRPPVVPLLQRMEMVLACKHVDYAGVNLGGADSRPAILDSGCHFIVHGDDWTGDALMKQMGFDQAWLDANYLTLLYMPYTVGISTTQLIAKKTPSPYDLSAWNRARGGCKL